MIVKQLNRPNNNFTMIPNALTAVGLSLEAIGLMTVIAISEQDWNAADLEAATGIARKKRQRIFRELRNAGLLEQSKEQTERGTWHSAFIFDWSKLFVQPPDEPEAQKGPPVPPKVENRRPKRDLPREAQKGPPLKKKNILRGNSPLARNTQFNAGFRQHVENLSKFQKHMIRTGLVPAGMTKEVAETARKLLRQIESN